MWSDLQHASSQAGKCSATSNLNIKSTSSLIVNSICTPALSILTANVSLIINHFGHHLILCGVANIHWVICWLPCHFKPVYKFTIFIYDQGTLYTHFKYIKIYVALFIWLSGHSIILSRVNPPSTQSSTPPPLTTHLAANLSPTTTSNLI